MIQASLSVTTESGLVFAESEIAAADAISMAAGVNLHIAVERLTTSPPDRVLVQVRWGARQSDGSYALDERSYDVPLALRCRPRRLPRGLRAGIDIALGPSFNA